MNWPIWLGGAVLAVLVVGVLVVVWPDADGDGTHVSRRWLDEHERAEAEHSAEFEGVPWARPFHHATDYCGWLQRTRCRVTAPQVGLADRSTSVFAGRTRG